MARTKAQALERERRQRAEDPNDSYGQWDTDEEQEEYDEEYQAMLQAAQEEEQDELDEQEGENEGEAGQSSEHVDAAGASSSRGNSRGGRGRKRKRQARAPPPVELQPEPLDTALKRFLEVTQNIARDQAQDALQEALEKSAELKAAIDVHTHAHQQQKAKVPTLWDDINWWIDEAQMCLACLNEFDAEKVQLEEAMAMSLKQAEAERLRHEAEEQQLGQVAALQRRFGGSPVLSELSPVCQVQALLCSQQASAALNKLLALEKKTKQWYTGRGTFVFWEGLGKELAAHLKQLASQQGITQLPLQCAPSTSDQPSNLPSSAAGTSAGTSAGPSSSLAPQQPSSQQLEPTVAQCLMQLASKLEEKESFIQVEIARMPTNSKDAVYVPQIFKLPPGIDEMEVMNVFSDSE